MSESALLDLSARLRRYLLKRVRDEHAVEDLTQDILLKLHLHRDRLPHEPRRQRAWALRAARNASIDWYRLRRHSLPAIDSLPAPSDPAPLDSPLATQELAACMKPLLGPLPARYREAVELADLNGLPQHQVARQLGVSLSGAKSRIQRGRQQLRSIVSQCCDVELGARGELRSIEPTARSAAFCNPSC